MIFFLLLSLVYLVKSDLLAIADEVLVSEYFYSVDKNIESVVVNIYALIVPVEVWLNTSNWEGCDIYDRIYYGDEISVKLVDECTLNFIWESEQILINILSPITQTVGLYFFENYKNRPVSAELIISLISLAVGLIIIIYLIIMTCFLVISSIVKKGKKNYRYDKTEKLLD